MACLVQRGDTYYVQWRVGRKIKRRSLRTGSLQIAKEKLRQFESAHVRGDELPLPARTNVVDIITRYVDHVRTIKTANRYREVMHTFFSWAINEQGIRTPGDENSVSKV